MFMVTCQECSGECCKMLATAIDKPETPEEFEDIKWYLYHKKTRVLIDKEDDWYVEFKTPCKMLTKDGNCKIYQKRPPVCREYSPGECDVNDGKDTKVMFNNVREYEKWLKNRPNSL